MTLHPHVRGDNLAQKFALANEHWNLEKLYKDIMNAKQQERLRQCKQLTSTEKACLRGLLCDYSPTEIATELHREPSGLRVEFSRGLYRYIESLTGVCIKSWSNIPKHLEKAGYKLHNNIQEPINFTRTILNPNCASSQSKISEVLSTTSCRSDFSQNLKSKIDWGEAMDVSIFYGRTDELAKLQKWVQKDKCRLIAILGMGGIGKTALSVKLGQVVQDEFEFVIWYSLRYSPPVYKLLDTLIKFFSCQQETNLPETVGEKISRLIEYLRNSRCLLIFDNFDVLLCGGQRAGTYRHGYEDYGELLQSLGEVLHQSCLLITSREKATEIAALAGEFLPVRSLQLSGLNNDEARGILAAKGLSGTMDEQKKLIQCYGGNPLVLKMAATSILDLFDSSISDFLQERTVIFNGVRSLLDRQFERLSPLEKDVMYWICINREAIGAGDLQRYILPAVSKADLLESLESLTWRSLIQKGQNAVISSATFTQQPIVMEYMTNRLVEAICQEIKTGDINLLNRYALMKFTAKDYIKKNQARVFLMPILANLTVNFKLSVEIEQKIKILLEKLGNDLSATPGYCGENLINLLQQFQVDLTGYNFIHDEKAIAKNNTNTDNGIHLEYFAFNC